MSDLNLGRLEGKVNKTPVSRQFNKQFDLEKVSMSEVVLNDDNEILSVSNGYITDATGRYLGEFNVTGQYILPDADNRTLNISIPFAVYNTVLDKIKTVLNELESNDFDEVVFFHGRFLLFFVLHLYRRIFYAKCVRFFKKS